MKVQITMVNKDRGYIIFEEIQEWDICNTTSEVYKTALKEYGRCMSKVYRNDVKDDKPKHLGWAFEKKCRYEDIQEPYIQEIWIVPLKSYEIKHIYEYAL